MLRLKAFSQFANFQREPKEEGRWGPFERQNDNSSNNNNNNKEQSHWQCFGLSFPAQQERNNERGERERENDDDGPAAAERRIEKAHRNVARPADSLAFVLLCERQRAIENRKTNASE